ncbi:MAG: hypothetical protein U0U67_05265 [Chitinophagales bacterium]
MKKKILWFSWMILMCVKSFAAETAENSSDKITEVAINKEWNVTENAAIDLKSSYHEVNIVYWNKNAVRVEAKVSTSAPLENVEDELKGCFDAELKKSNDNFSLNTNFDAGRFNTLYRWLDRKIKGYKVTLYCKTTVYLPAATKSLDINARYCEVNQSAASTIPTKIIGTESHMNFDYTEHLKVNITYSDFKLKKCNDITIAAAYGKIILEDATIAEVFTSYTDVIIGNCQTLKKCNTTYGDCKIGKVGNAKISTSYTDVTIDYLSNDATISATYGDLTIKEIAKTSNAININSSYTDVKLSVNADNPMNFNASGAYSDIDFDAGIFSTISKNSNSHNVLQFSANSKNATVSSLTITIKSTYNNITLRKK